MDLFCSLPEIQDIECRGIEREREVEGERCRERERRRKRQQRFGEREGLNGTQTSKRSALFHRSGGPGGETDKDRDRRKKEKRDMPECRSPGCRKQPGSLCLIRTCSSSNVYVVYIIGHEIRVCSVINILCL